MKNFRDYSIASLIVVFALAVGGCGSGGGSASLDSLTKNSTDDMMLSYNQTGTLYPPPDPIAPPAANAWETVHSQKIPDLRLLAQYDSSGPDAWDNVAHPLVYVSSAGGGYGGLLAVDWDPATRQFSTNVSPNAQKGQGIVIINAYTKEVVTSREYLDIGAVAPALPKTVYGEPHGAGLSSDGKWIYVEGTDSRSTMSSNDCLLIINARTLKVDKIINSRVHHARNYYDSNLKKNLVLIDGWNNKFFALDPSDNNRVVGALAASDLNGSGYLGFVDYAGKYLFVTDRTGFSTTGGVAVVDLKTWQVTTRINTDDTSPIWVTFSINGKYAYVSGGHESSIARINISDANPANWKYDGRSNAGTEGPYGITLNWNDSIIFGVGKNEGAANKGEELGIVRTANFGDPAKKSNGGVLGPLYLNGCTRADHAIVHPDPAVNELWVACNSSFENVVVKMGPNTTQSAWSTAQDWQSFKVVKNIPMPRNASTHNGAFVKYSPNWTGELLSDTNGMQGSAIAVKKVLDKGPTP